jgi:carbonic anhydrase
MGSLTTPPCLESTSWYMLQSLTHFSAAQIQCIGNLMGYNARPVRKCNHRMVLEALVCKRPCVLLNHPMLFVRRC